MPLPSIAISRATAVQLGAVAAIGIATVASGGTLSPLLASVLGGVGAKVASDAVVGLIPNLLSGLFSDRVKHSASQAEKTRRSRQNHDVQRAINTAIAKCLRLAVASYPKEIQPPAYLAAIADSIEKNPLSLTIDESPNVSEAAGEPAITRVLSGDIEAIRGRDVLTTEQWTDLLRGVAAATGTLSPTLNVSKAVVFCEEHFATQLVQVLKEMGAESDPAWFAVVMRFLGEIHADGKEIRGDVKAQAAAIAALQQALTAHASEIKQAFEAMKTACERRAAVPDSPHTVHDAEEVEAIKGIAQRLGADLPEMKATLTSLVNAVGRVETTTRQTHDVVIRVEKFLTGQLSAATLKTVGNLAAARVAPNRFFTGREDELARLHAALAGGNVAIVHALTGEGGIGKTELAKVYALIYADTYDSVWWIDASSTTLRAELMKVYEKVAGQGAPENTPTEHLCQALVDLWKGTRPLIVLDNVDEPDTFTIFSALPSARVLATTRQHHKTLQGVEPFALGVLPVKDAVALMRKEIVRDRRDVTDADLTEIAKELDGHALAVALAGAYLANYPDVPAKTVLAKLRGCGVGDVEVAAEGNEHDSLGLAYRRSVAASLSLHFESAEVKPALPVLAAAAFMHPTGITVEWLAKGAAMSEDSVRTALRTLAKYSILKYEQTVSLHRLTQGVARSRNDVAGGEAGIEILKRLLNSILELHRDHDHDEVRQSRTLFAPHVVAICDHVLSLPSATAIHRDASQCHRRNAEHYSVIGDLLAAMLSINKAIAWAESVRPLFDSDLVYCQASRSGFRRAQGDYMGAREDIQSSINWLEAQTPPDAGRLAANYASRARIRRGCGDFKGAEEDINLSITWAKNQYPRDERVLGMWLDWRARILLKLSKPEEATADIDESIRLGNRQIPYDGRDMAIRYASRANIRLVCGDLNGAAEDIQRCIDWFEAQIPLNEREIALHYETKALILAKSRLFVDAGIAIDESLRLHIAVFGPDHEWTKITIDRQRAIHEGRHPR